MDYLQNRLLLSLLPYFAVDLPSALRIALLGLAAGFHPCELRVLPGLGQAKRRRLTLRALEDMGRIVREGASYVCVPASPLFETEVRDLLKRHSKLRRALDILADPLARLKARCLGTIAGDLEPEERATLLSALEEAEAARRADELVRKRARCSILHNVARRVPGEVSRPTPEGPRPPRAPAGLLARSQRLMPDYGEPLARLYNALVPYGEEVVDHWWRILQACVDRGLTGEVLWDAWRTRLESYRLRRRIPLSNGVRLIGIEPARIKACFPVPNEGYGFWVEQELSLWRRFRARFEPALGYFFTRALWVQAHEAVPDMLRQQHGGARASLVSEEHYEDCLFRAGEACSGLSDKVLEDLRKGFRRTAAVRAARANCEREVTALAIRAALQKAARLAADERVPATEEDKKDRDWAISFLRAVAKRTSAGALAKKDFEALLTKAASAGKRGGRRFRRPKLAEQVRRELDSSFELEPVIIGPRERFPIERVVARVLSFANEIASANATDEERTNALQGLCDYVEHRDCIDIVYDDGTAERRSIRDAVTVVTNEERADELVSKLVASIRHAPDTTEVLAAA